MFENLHGNLHGSVVGLTTPAMVFTLGTSDCDPKSHPPIPKCVVGCKNLCFSLLGEKLCPKPKLQLSNIRKRPPEDFFFGTFA